MIRREVRIARGERRCDGRGYDDCTRLILKGERYVASVASPYHDDFGNVGWWHMDLCAPCVAYFLDIPAEIKEAVLADAHS